jgi:hypothetical protein
MVDDLVEGGDVGGGKFLMSLKNYEIAGSGAIAAKVPHVPGK